MKNLRQLFTVWKTEVRQERKKSTGHVMILLPVLTEISWWDSAESSQQNHTIHREERERGCWGEDGQAKLLSSTVGNQEIAPEMEKIKLSLKMR